MLAAVGDDANTVHPQKRTAAVFLVIGLVSDGRGTRSRASSAPSLRMGVRDKLVFEPRENRDANRFARFQNHVADKAVANHHLDRILEKIVAFDIAAES